MPAGADSAAAPIAKAVVASWVVLVPAAAVGAVGAPVRAGLASGAAPDMSATARVTAPVLPATLATVLACAPAWTELSLSLSAALMNPAADVLASPGMGWQWSARAAVIADPAAAVDPTVCADGASLVRMVAPAAERAADTNAVVAIWVVLVPADAVGAVGAPVRAGLASGAAPEMSPTARVTAPVLPATLLTPVLILATTDLTKAVVASLVELSVFD